MQPKIKTFNSVVVVAVFLLLNFFLSIFLQLFLASLFGAKMEMDAYIVAMVIPLVIYSLIVSYEAIFIPLFKSYSIKNEKHKLNKLISLVFNLLFLVLTGIALVGVWLSPKLVSLLAPGLNPATRDLAVVLFRLMIPSVLFSGLADYLRGVYFSEEKFFLPALVPVANIAVILATTFLFHKSLGIKSVALGVLLGSVAQTLILLPAFLFKKRYEFTLDIRHTELPQISKKLVWLTVGGASLGLLLLLEKYLASSFPEGLISSMGYANKITSLMALLPSAAIPTVLLPQLSGYYALGDMDRLRELLSKGMRMTFLCVFPIAVLLMILRLPLIKLLLERGAFDATAVNNTSIALVCYLGVLIAMGISRVLGIGFLAMHDVKRPALLMIGTFLLYAACAPWLSRVYSFKGLAFAFSLACLVSMSVEVYILRKKLGGIDGRKLLNSFLKIGLASLAMGVTVQLIFYRLATLSLILRMGFTVLAGFLVFNLFCFILRVDELKLIYETIRLKMQGAYNRK